MGIGGKLANGKQWSCSDYDVVQLRVTMDWFEWNILVWNNVLNQTFELFFNGYKGR